MPIGYVTETPMLAENIHIGTSVYVPIWKSGVVIGWDNGRVTQIFEPSVEYNLPEYRYIVRLETFGAMSGKEVLYYPYSIQCGVCMGRTDLSGCHQCHPSSQEVGPA